MIGIKIQLLYETFKISKSNDNIELLLTELFEKNNIPFHNF